MSNEAENVEPEDHALADVAGGWSSQDTGATLELGSLAAGLIGSGVHAHRNWRRVHTDHYDSDGTKVEFDKAGYISYESSGEPRSYAETHGLFDKYRFGEVRMVSKETTRAMDGSYISRAKYADGTELAMMHGADGRFKLAQIKDAQGRSVEETRTGKIFRDGKGYMERIKSNSDRWFGSKGESSFGDFRRVRDVAPKPDLSESTVSADTDPSLPGVGSFKSNDDFSDGG